MLTSHDRRQKVWGWGNRAQTFQLGLEGDNVLLHDSGLPGPRPFDGHNVASACLRELGSHLGGVHTLNSLVGDSRGCVQQSPLVIDNVFVNAPSHCFHCLVLLLRPRAGRGGCWGRPCRAEEHGGGTGRGEGGSPGSSRWGRPCRTNRGERRPVSRAGERVHETNMQGLVCPWISRRQLIGLELSRPTPFVDHGDMIAIGSGAQPVRTQPPSHPCACPPLTVAQPRRLCSFDHVLEVHSHAAGGQRRHAKRAHRRVCRSQVAHSGESAARWRAVPAANCLFAIQKKSKYEVSEIREAHREMGDLGQCMRCLQQLRLPALVHTECACVVCCQCSQDGADEHTRTCSAVVSASMPAPGIEVHSIEDARRHGLLTAASVMQVPSSERRAALQATLAAMKARAEQRARGLWYARAHRLRTAIEQVTSRDQLDSVVIEPPVRKLLVSAPRPRPMESLALSLYDTLPSVSRSSIQWL